MKTSISLPDDLVKRIKDFNEVHRDRPINVSGVCQTALENVLESNISLRKMTKEVNMEIDKKLLYTMLRDFWAIDNNDLCHDVSIISLKKMGFSIKEIKHLIPHLNIQNIAKAEEALEDSMKDTANYYLADDD